MTTLTADNEVGARLRELTSSEAWLSRAIRGIAAVGAAQLKGELLPRFRAVARDVGADAALFVSFLQEHPTFGSYRSLIACDPEWAPRYAYEQWFECDPWLRHARESDQPVRSNEIHLRSSREEAFVERAARAGFCSAFVIPAPSTHGIARVGMLALGSAKADFFEDDGYAIVQTLARALAMEVHAWLARSIRQDLIDKARITDGDIALLRHKAAGHSSKVIAAAMGTQATTIDCQFQRLSGKLGTQSRRSALRLAWLYGLL